MCLLCAFSANLFMSVVCRFKTMDCFVNVPILKLQTGKHQPPDHNEFSWEIHFDEMKWFNFTFEINNYWYIPNGEQTSFVHLLKKNVFEGKKPSPPEGLISIFATFTQQIMTEIVCFLLIFALIKLTVINEFLLQSLTPCGEINCLVRENWIYPNIPNILLL